MSTQASENSKSGIIGVLWGIVLYSIAYLENNLHWHIQLLSQAQYLEGYVKGLALIITGTGGCAGYYRNKQSPVQTIQQAAQLTHSAGYSDAQPQQHSEDASVHLRPKYEQTKVKKNHFSLIETDCKGKDCDCDYSADFDGLDPEVLAIANDLREHFGKAFCTSGYRCLTHNEREGGEMPGPNRRGSYHIKKMAMDLKFEAANPKQIYAYLIKKYPRQYGFGLYKRFVHIDCRRGVWARKPAPGRSWKQYTEDSAVDAVLA